jgi:hypothetical protein
MHQDGEAEQNMAGCEFDFTEPYRFKFATIRSPSNVR